MIAEYWSYYVPSNTHGYLLYFCCCCCFFFFTPGGDKSYIRSSEGERGKIYIVYVFNHSLYFSKLHIAQFTEVKIGIQVIHSTPSSVKLQYFKCATDLAQRINHASVK